MSPITCREVYQAAFDLIDGDLTNTEKLKLWFHLLLCRHCRRFVRQAQVTMDYVGKHPELVTWQAIDVDDATMGAIVETLLLEEEKKKNDP